LISRVAQGTAAEDLALRYLEARGLALVTRNFRYRGGELDLIMRDGEHLVFVEVRSRRQPLRHAGRISHPKQTATPAPRAALYLQRQRLDLPCRFDVVAILQADGEPQVEWIRDAFQLT
jgi:putative endonuclease